jgi:hypothetical protein
MSGRKQLSGHETIRAMLPLAAAGVLGRNELATVEEHAAACPECKRELDALRLYSRSLQALPQPKVPEGLLQRTQARVLQERDLVAGRRRQSLTLGMLTAFSWILGIVFWTLVRMIAGGAWKILGTNLADPVMWFWVSALFGWTTAGVAVVILGRRNELARRFS